jgi:two-component system, OmpR family, phosphate regulon sensor histidine kinase PhoR
VKKIFPVIIVLISLSLAGTIYVQYNWLKTMLINKQEEFDYKIVRAIDEVGQDLMEEKNTLPSLRNYRLKPGGFNFPSDQLQRELMRPATIAQKFTAYEIGEKLRHEFNNQGLKDVPFEFAVLVEDGFLNYEYQLKSNHFLEKFEDSVNKRWQYPLQPPGGSDLENLVPMQQMILIVPNFNEIVFRQMKWMVLGSVFFTLMIISAFSVTVYALLRQKKLSEIKNDFINNMTHEFKTPLATISLAVDALRNNKVIEDRTRMEYFSGIIKEENKRMNKHVETILQAALMDRQEIRLNKAPVHVHDLIKQVISNYTLQLQDKDGRIELDLNAKYDLINADEVHFRNLVSNLIDNAVKYSNDKLVLKVSSSINDSNLVLKFEDNGIGMSKETVKRIFEKFYRAHTGNLHNVKGFGLGLSYVKTIIDAHDGRIKVDSSPGKGSTFTLEVPYMHDKVTA